MLHERERALSIGHSKGRQNKIQTHSPLVRNVSRV